MTKKVFWDDPYRTTLDTVVTHVDGDRVQVEATIFFAFSGGQESDAGSLGDHPVIRADKQGLDIVYTLAHDHVLRVGDRATWRIDWARRYRLMRLHFAAEMVLQLVYRLRPGIERIGAHIAQDKARIDFASEASLAPLFPEIESAAADLSKRDLRIVTDFSDIDAQRRFWTVDGFATMACGGTHPASTGEIGMLTLKRKNTGKGKERIEVMLLEPQMVAGGHRGGPGA
ncbi:alanyl-tRNA editing protein [Burkholderia cenocepacia]|uniref:alanyl-tRNA editing protein n=1 Tax=Burkholderia cenocepacia TaxID=95486 RepID=UPI00196A8A5F|nr:alanyl-tRNA editing protein [Burkholderia cenocepacia]MBN3503014.1 alanyl-tRNA editing protein [Burkholderia cenocepacia]MCO1394481.1 alanyl-tRNA editing protein [Burkholderia cenocepacia]MCO1404703.1 alanyl-tRNA editing protein [Burkholderia cenocepacia]UQN96240.1 alanyl-tRNA editing protein [Burkholderia cenocepacia]UQO02793.1 alanyl-tRNA editing protein [Burkholderia cenocepacia]